MPLKRSRHNFQCLTPAECLYIIHGSRAPFHTRRALTTSSTNKQKRTATSPPERHAKQVFSGIQPTGIPHLGNYLGALRTWKSYQDEKSTSDPTKYRNHHLYFSVVDFHALTSPLPATKRYELTRETYAALLAMGLSNQYSTLFLQSHSPYHTELMWYLSTVASMGYLSRMTQWKSKIGITDETGAPESSPTAGSAKNDDVALDTLSESQREKLKLALFSYPVLQAADILLYNADTVPIGEDQAQHLELTRHLARAFNRTYAREGKSNILMVPKAVISPAKRIMSLLDPTKKMSKSDPHPRASILITDDAATIQQKINGALTDTLTGISYDPIQRPGVSNLLTILAATEPEGTGSTPQQLAQELAPLTMRALKSLVTQSVVACLSGIGPVFRELMEPGNRKIEREMARGAAAANTYAARTMLGVRRAVGGLKLNPKDREAGHSDAVAAKVARTGKDEKTESEKE